MKRMMKLKAAAFVAIACTFMLAAPASAQLTDPEIASIAVTANQIDIDYAHIAQQNTKNQEVLRFAKTMIADHQSVIDQAVALAGKLHVTPKDNATTQKLKSDAAKMEKSLKAKKGAAFDRAYVNNEVNYHRAVISTVEKVLIPQSDNAELKSLLQSVMPVLRAHLEHAEMLQKKLAVK